MKNRSTRIFLIIFSTLISVLVITFFLYMSRINILGNVMISDYSINTEIYAQSPTGGDIEFEIQDSTLQIQNRFLRRIVIITDNPDSFKAKLQIGNKIISVDKNNLIKENQNTFYLSKEVYPNISFTEKIESIKSNQVSEILQYHFFKSIKFALSVIAILLIAFFVYRISVYVIKNRNKLKRRILFRIKSSFRFVKQEIVYILLLILFAAFPVFAYCMHDPEILRFLDTTMIRFILSFTVIIYPLLFIAFFSKKLKLNSFFWWSFLIGFVLLVFAFKPEIFLYGTGFRDDMSKFFVKAYQNDALTCLFTPDSGYLNLFQNLIALVLFKVLGFRQYFPEALQLCAALSFSGLFALFNIKGYRLILKNDILRFVLSLLFVVSPFVFTSANFLFEIPFVAAALLIPAIFIYLISKGQNKNTLYIIFFVAILFALSKPIFILFLPFLIVVLIVYRKNKQLFWGAICLSTAMIIQLVIVYFSNGILNSGAGSDLGTKYEMAFTIQNYSLLKLFTGSGVLFIRKFSEILGVKTSINETSNLIIFILFTTLIVLITYYNLKKLIKNKKNVRAWLSLSFLFLSFSVIVMYFKSVPTERLVAGIPDFTNFSFIDMLGLPVRFNTHRYLMLASFANLMIIILVIGDIIEKYSKARRIKFILMLVLIVYLASIPFFKRQMYYEEIKNKTEKYSYWRAYNHLIFNSDGDYYIPYTGFPEQKNCIKNGIDKIIDIESYNGPAIILDSVYPGAEKWQIVQIVLLNDSDLIPEVSGKTVNGDIVETVIANEVLQETPALVYQFDDFYELNSIFITCSDKKKSYNELVRIIGKYE